MNETLQITLQELEQSAQRIPQERRRVLQPLIDHVTEKQLANETVRLNFICTHNSRRSHIAQVLAAAAAQYVDLENVECFSGGTEETQIHPNAIQALEQLGVPFAGEDKGKNPHFLVDLGEALMLEIFSKRYDDDTNPQRDFAAVMVCSSAEEACPFVAGAAKRFSITFDDPKEFDEDDDPLAGYVRRAKEIGSEFLYAMQQASQNIGR